MRLVLVLAAAACLSWLTYWRLEQLGRRAWLAALCRGVAWGTLGLLLLDLTCALPAGPPARPLVLLDGSLSMIAGGGRWQEARDSARAWGDVLLFGDQRPGRETLPSFGRSELGPALRAAAAADRQVIVVTDGEIDDRDQLPPEALARVGVRGFPRQSGFDRAISRLRGPDRVTAGDTVRLEVELRSSGAPTAAAPDSARLEVRLGPRVLARRAVRLGAAELTTTVLTFSSTGLSGDQVVSVNLTGPADAEPRDDARLWLVRVTPTPGVVLIASPPDWDARFLYRAIRDVAQLPVRGYGRLQGGRWMSLEQLTPVSADEVLQAGRRADVLVLKGNAPEVARETRARGRWFWPSGEGGETVIPGEWYAAAPPASPVAGALIGLPVDSFPPLVEITPIEPAAGEWIGLTAQQARRGAERPVLVGQAAPGGRRVTVAAEGLWRWAFRGGSSEQGYRALVSATLSWLLGAADSAGGKARPVRPVVANGRPILFEWVGAGVPVPLGISLAERRDTLRFDGAGRAELWLPPGQHRYQLDGGGAGLLAVDTWSEEWIPRPVALADRTAPDIRSAGFTNARQWIWLFGLCLVGFAGEWLARRRLGLR